MRRTTVRIWVYAQVLLSTAVCSAALPLLAPHYLSNINMALVLLPPPPGTNSVEQRTDLADVLLAHKAIDSIDAGVSNAEKHVSIFTFTPVVGSFLQTNQFPITEAFFRRVRQDTDLVVENAKLYWERPRPYVVDTNLFDGEEERFSGSYPSGHATLGTVLAVFLSEMFPNRREAILAKGMEIGWHRVVLAKHYPSDIYAGRVLGQRIVHEMRKSYRFRRDFQEAKIELTRWLRRVEAN